MLHIYHPNKTVKGFATSFSYSEKDSTIFASLVKQSGWDEKSGNGTFKDSLNSPTGRVNIKLEYVEAAAILDCIERNRPFKTFHDHEESPKTIQFVPWMSNDEQPVHKGYSFSITVGNKKDASFKNSFYIGLTFAEARLIREFLVCTIHRHYNKSFDQRVSRAELNKGEERASKTPLTSL